MAVEIRQTTIESAKDRDVVQLYISDAPLGDESAEIALQLSVCLPKREAAVILERMQHQALKEVQSHLSTILIDLAQRAQRIE